MELESLAGHRAGRAIAVPIRRHGTEVWEVDPLPLLATLGARHRQGADRADLAADFHASIIAATVTLVVDNCERFNLRTVVLGGGVFQNARMATLLPDALEALGLRVLLARELSPNDGGISYGQAAIAAAQLSGDVAPSIPTGG